MSLAPSAGARAAPALAALALAAALTDGAWQAGRAFMHPKQGLDFTPGWVAARMAESGDWRVYDLAALRDQARRFGVHGPLGAGDPIVEYAYAPWVLAVYAPFAALPWDAARAAWFALAVLACYAGAALAGAAAAPEPAARRAWAFAGLAAAGLYFPAAYGFMNGQANDLPLLGLALGLWWLRGGKPFAAGLALAPALAWKPFTALVVLFLVARREGRALAGLALGCTGVVLLTLPWTGARAWAAWVTYLAHAKLVAVPDLRNHSIAAEALRFLAPGGAVTASARAVVIALQALATLVVLAALWPRFHREAPHYALQFGLTLVLGVLLTPLAWEHYGVFLLPAFLATAATLVATPGGRVAGAVLGASYAVWGLMLQQRAELEALAAAAPLLAPARLYAMLALVGLGARLCIAAGRPPPAASVPGALNREAAARA